MAFSHLLVIVFRIISIIQYLLNNRKTLNKNILIDISLIYQKIADVAKLADALDLGSSASRHVGSSPSVRTKSHLFLFTNRSSKLFQIIKIEKLILLFGALLN